MLCYVCCVAPAFVPETDVLVLPFSCACSDGFAVYNLVRYAPPTSVCGRLENLSHLNS